MYQQTGKEQSTFRQSHTARVKNPLFASIEQWVNYILQTARQRETYVKQGYLILSIPLGLCFCAVLLLGIVSGIGLLVFGIGLPLLYLTLLAAWGMTLVERRLVRRWLLVEIPALPASLLNLAQGRLWLRLRRHLSQWITWKTLAYLLVKGPFSLCVALLYCCSLLFSGCVAMLVAGGWLLALPVLVFVGGFLMMSKQAEKSFSLFKQLLALSVAVMLFPLGLLGGIADLWGYFAHLMLSIDERERELLEARELIKQEQARAERAEQQRRDLIANLSHDLRTPVANIRGHAEALLKEAHDSAATGSGSAQQQAYLAIIHREAVRLGTLFDELLALAREEAHDLQLSLRAVNLSEVVEEVYQTIKPLAYRERRITVGRTIAPGLPNVRADRERIQQVLLNLVRNAIAYTPHGGLVAMTLQQADKAHLLLSVADTGMGIAPEDQARIFERFYRAPGSAPPVQGGAGLGLSIVRELVEAMGGSVTVESTVGEGSCFSIILPVA